MSAEQFASGQVAFQLNGATSKGDLVWGQTVGTDPTPVFHTTSPNNTVFTVGYGGVIIKSDYATYGGSVTLPTSGDASKPYAFKVNGEDWDGTNITSDTSVVVFVGEANPPVITGITDGGTYYTDVSFTVTDENEVTVTVDGSTISSKNGIYSIAADSKEHEVVATDAIGNATTYTITVYKTFNITLPTQTTGYSLTSTQTNPIKDGDDYTFELEIADGYSKTESFAVKVGDDILSPNEDGSYTIKNINSDKTVSVIGVADITAPEAQITLGTNKWRAFLNSVTFGLFFKENQTVTVTASDAGSGLDTVEYLLSKEVFESADAISETWNALTLKNGKAEFSITKNDKAYIYVRATDNAGRVTVINSDGIVVYTDSVQITTSVSFTKLSGENKTASVRLNGNTIKEIRNGTDVVNSNDCTVTQSGDIIFMADYLQSLSAGEYTLHIFYNPLGESYADGNGNTPPDETTISLLIEKATGTVNITNDISRDYNGTVIDAPTYNADSTGKITVEYKLQNAGDDTYTTTTPKNAGEYTVRVVADADGNYTASSATANFSIHKKSVTINNVTVKATKEYDAKATAEITSAGTLSANYDADNLKIKMGTATYADKTVGTGKPVTFSGFALTGSASENYTLTTQPATSTADIIAKKLTVTVSIANKQYNGMNDATFNGMPSLVGVISGEDVTLTNGTPTFTNTATGENIAISFTEFAISGTDASNYTLTQPTGVKANIFNNYEANQNTDYTVNSNDWQNEDFVVTANEGYQISATNTMSGWQTSLSASDETADGSLAFYVRNIATGAISNKVTEHYQIDKTAPTGTVTLGTNSWTEFLNNITFGLFFKDTQTISVTAGEDLSGIAKTEYAMSDKALTLEQVKALTNWAEGTSVNVTPEDAKQFVCFFRLTDKAGNVTYLSSDGAEYDTSAPTVSAQNGKTYCSATEVTVTDKNTDTVTLNNDPVTLTNGKFTVSPQAGTQTIVATDKAGNTTTVTITVNNGHTPNADDGDCTTPITCKYCDAVTTAAKAHDFSGTYFADGANGHYQVCQNEGCTQHSATVPHTGTDDDNCETAYHCTTCGYEIKAAQTHDFSGAWQKDENNHWHICTHDGCTVTDTKIKHNYSSKGTETAPTYFADGSRTDTCVCGASTTVTLPKLIDNAAPTATITIGKNTWNSLLNNVSFGLFFKETQTVTVTANDNESGVDKTYYYLASSETTDFTGVNWTELTDSFSINPNNKYVVYVKVTDKVGNETIVNSDGIVLENVVPQISAENNKTYCAAVEVTVTDENLDTVTLNGNAVTPDADGTFTVAPAEGAQTITATDKAGNQTTVTITVNDGHTWDEGKITTKPTAAAEGVKTYTCKHCDATKTEPVAKLAPTIIEGKGETYKPGNKDGLTFKSDAAFADFISVSVDGNVIGTNQYTTAEGSTIVTLTADYLATLSAGKHTLEIKSVSGTASTEFIIEAKAADTKPEDSHSPQTGDNSNMVLWICLLFVSGGALTAFGVSKKRRKHSED